MLGNEDGLPHAPLHELLDGAERAQQNIDGMLLPGSMGLNIASMMLDTDAIVLSMRTATRAFDAACRRLLSETNVSTSLLILGWHRVKDGYRSSKCCKVSIPGYAVDSARQPQ
ncbi:hypothetical protein ACMX25_08215 [Caballeronia sp. 15715]|uniref:hypothetical protein n=1 Tax=Caballeronia sp. 15715 TaxID=3391030 RepID=UPI0039E3CAC3